MKEMIHAPNEFAPADETQHVRFGKRWLPKLLEHVGETRPLDDYIADVIKVWESEYRTGKLTLLAG